MLLRKTPLRVQKKHQKKLEAEAKKKVAARKQEYEVVELRRKKAETGKDKNVKKKEQEIYSTFQNARAETRKRQQKEEKQLDSIYIKQEKQSRKHEEEKRKAVKAARTKAQAGTMGAKSLEDFVKGLSGKQAGNPNARPSRPPNEAAVIKWWKAEEGSRNVGRDETGNLQAWFHGPISRQDSEKMLEGEAQGAFLIRVSTRIWGYTLSFVDSDRFKHFLVDAADGQYNVCGAQTRCHKDLNTLVKFHGTPNCARSALRSQLSPPRLAGRAATTPAACSRGCARSAASGVVSIQAAGVVAVVR